MKLQIVRYEESFRKSWDDFLKDSINGTFLHSRSFFDHNPLNKIDDHSFIYLKNNKIAGILPNICYLNNGHKIFHSHLRSTYGGFILNKEIGSEEAIDMVDLLIDEAKKEKISEIIIRNPFRIFHQTICDESDYAMFFRGFKIKSRELEIAIDLRNNIDTIKKNYQNGTKYNIKKAIKNVDTNLSDDYQGFWKLLETNLAEKHDLKPVHTFEEFSTLIEHVGDDKIKLFGGFVNNKLVCGVVVFLFSNNAVHAQYIAADSNYQEYRPLNAVLNHIIEWGCKNKYQYFNLGTPNENEGKIMNFGLCHFKEGFGGRGTLRETMSLTL